MTCALVLVSRLWHCSARVLSVSSCTSDDRRFDRAGGSTAGGAVAITPMRLLQTAPGMEAETAGVIYCRRKEAPAIFVGSTEARILLSGAL